MKNGEKAGSFVVFRHGRTSDKLCSEGDPLMVMVFIGTFRKSTNQRVFEV